MSATLRRFLFVLQLTLDGTVDEGFELHAVLAQRFLQAAVERRRHHHRYLLFRSHGWTIHELFRCVKLKTVENYISEWNYF